MIHTSNKTSKRFLAPAAVTLAALFSGFGATACSSPDIVAINGHELEDLGDGYLEGKDGVVYAPDGTAYNLYSSLNGGLYISQYVCSETAKEDALGLAEQRMKDDANLNISVSNLNRPNRNPDACGGEKRFIEPGALELEED